jgi:hypothetical protein
MSNLNSTMTELNLYSPTTAPPPTGPPPADVGNVADTTFTPPPAATPPTMVNVSQKWPNVRSNTTPADSAAGQNADSGKHAAVDKGLAPCSHLFARLEV